MTYKNELYSIFCRFFLSHFALFGQFVFNLTGFFFCLPVIVFNSLMILLVLFVCICLCLYVSCVCYFLLLFLNLFSCLFSKERKRKCGAEWVERYGGFGKKWGRGTVIKIYFMNFHLRLKQLTLHFLLKLFLQIY